MNYIKIALTISFLVVTTVSNAQLEPGLLFGLTNATTSEINAVTTAEIGTMVYNTDVKEIYVFDGTSWASNSQPNVYMGVLTITSTGIINVTGIPFQPSQISFTAHANIEALNIDSDNGTRNNDSGIANTYGSMNGFARNDNGTTTQQVIYVGGSGNSINDISRFSSSNACIAIRYSNQNGDKLGITSASLNSFNTNGFTLTVGSHADNLVVLYQAYK
ncbi:hypothetical protein [Maribacter hydrothermalis]|uniref:Curlin associated repeat-containing protein n=1 Tax=Maribacter hydrothermalis TaxID=1836467 RepID=A0A1B7ZE53_9FLAO|nr:hypothetical protein [Maribacter hydrothermalis]APQ16511.1 hypothetical protein BTR34_03815 [Maribacter hydrothermalis]OBR41583.1 hypothetical protein A9200_13220 [Maribacter hydrothermalis]